MADSYIYNINLIFLATRRYIQHNRSSFFKSMVCSSSRDRFILPTCVFIRGIGISRPGWGHYGEDKARSDRWHLRLVNIKILATYEKNILEFGWFIALLKTLSGKVLIFLLTSGSPSYERDSRDRKFLIMTLPLLRPSTIHFTEHVLN